MRQPHGRFSLVNVLPARSARAELVEPIVVGLQIYFDILRLRQHGNGRGARMHTTLGLGLWHALHAMRTAFIVQFAIDPFALKAERDLAEPAPIRGTRFHDLALPPLLLRVVLVHLKQVVSEQRRLFAAGTRPNFHDAPRPIGVLTTDRRVEKLAPQFLALAARFWQLGRRQLLLVGRTLLRHPLQFGNFIDQRLEAAILRRHFGQRTVLASDCRQLRAFGEHRRVAHFPLEFFEPVELRIELFANGRHVSILAGTDRSAPRAHDQACIQRTDDNRRKKKGGS